MTDEDALVRRLTCLGLEPDEAQAYVGLCRTGPAKAVDLADLMQVSRQRTYRALEKLEQHGALAVEPGRPRRFTPLPPDALFRALRARAQATVIDVDRAEAQLSVEFRRLAPMAVRLPHARFALVSGSAALQNQARDLFAHAQARIDLLVAAGGQAALLPDLADLDLLRRRARQGVAVRLLVPRTGPILAAAPGLAVRPHDAEVVSTILVADGEALVVLLGPSPAAPGAGLAFRSGDPAYVAKVLESFDRIWRKGVAVREGIIDAADEAASAAATAKNGVPVPPA